MTQLAEWLRQRIADRGLTQAQVAVGARVSQATLSGILTKDLIPRIPTLLRLARFFDADPLDLLALAGQLTRADQLPGAPPPGADHHDEHHLEWQLLVEFRRIPAEWQPDALDQIRWIARLAKRPRVHLIGTQEPDTP